MFKLIRTVADRALLVLMALPLSALAATEDFSSATWTNHQDLGTEVVINDLNIAVPSGASMKGVTVPAAIQIGYDPTRVATSVTISPASQWDRLNVSAITLTDLFQMPVPGVKLIGLLKGQQVAYAEADSLWTDGSGATTVSLTGFNNIDELKITGDVADETNSDVFFFIESLDYQLIAVPPEIVVILDSAGDAANTITAEQLNAIDGVSGALAANEPYYRDEIARLSIEDLDTAAEIQALVDDVNRSVASEPAADIPASVSVVEGDEVAVAITASDSNNDPLSYSLQAGSPAWLSIDNFASYTTTLADTGDFEVNPDNAAEQSSARGVARDSLGNIYFAVTDFRSGYGGAVAKIATDGSVSILAGSALFNPTITTNFEYIYSVAVDGNGNVYAADVSLKKVFKISGNTVTEFLTNVNSKGMVFANDGYLYVSNSNQVLKVNTAGVVEQTFSNITDPYGLDVDSSGNIYVASEINRVVYKVTAAGDVSVYAGIERARGSDDGISATFRSPTDVALDQSTGELYVTDATNHLIRKVATDGTVSTIAGTARASGTEDGLDAKFNNPAGLLMTATGDLIITDKNVGRIRHLSLKDNLGLSGIAPDPTGASESFQALINIDDGFGNTTVHTLNVTVLDAELDVITNAAGDRFNQVTDVQLNAVDGVSGAIAENQSKYRATLASLVAADVDSAEEIQALVDSVNSVPVFNSVATTTAVEGQSLSFTVTATDSAGDALTFTAATRLPAWLALSEVGILTGTPTNSDVGETVISVEVSDGFGNTAQQTLTITVLDAEINAVSSVAGNSNTVTAEQLNAVDGVSGALVENEAKYQAVIAGLTAEDLDNAADIQAMVNSVNSVPVFTSGTSTIVLEGDAFEWNFVATDSTGDALTFAAAIRLPEWLALTGAGVLTGTPTNSDVGETVISVEVSDGFGNTAEQTLTITVLDAEINTISTVAGTDNITTADQLNAVDGVSGALVANEAQYQAVIAGLTAEALDTAAEIQALVNSVNSVPVFTSATTASALEGDAFSWDFAATDSTGDALTFTAATRLPAWLALSDSGALTGTPTNSDVGETVISVEVSEGFGNTVEQALTITVLDAEINAVSSVAGNSNTVTAEQLNAVDGVSGALVENEAKYQAVIAGLTAEDLDNAADIQAMVNSVNSVPVFTSGTSTTALEGDAFSWDFVATDSAGDALTFTAATRLPAWLALSDSGALTGTPTNSDVGETVISVEVSDSFGNTVEQTLTITVLDAEINTISTVAGTDNATTAAQLNAVDGVSGALVANEAQYQAVIAGLTAEDLDTAAEIQALVNSVNSVPVFTSATTVTALEGDAFSWSFVATDNANDALIFAVKTGTTPSAWMTLSAAGVLTGTPLDADVGLHNITVEVSDGFGNTVEQTLAITVLDAEINAVASVAGVTNGITATELNAVEGVTGALSENNAKYQAAIAALTSEDLDSAAEIQTLVNSVNSVPQFVSEGTLRVNTGERAELVLSAVDEGDDEVTFSLAEGSVLPSWLNLAYRISPLPAGFTVGEPSSIPALVPLPISDKTSASLIAAPSTSDYGTYQVTLVAEDGFGNSGTQLVTVIVNAPGQLSISGEAAVGQTLSASVYDANNIDSTISYSWMSEATEVSQAQSYVVQASDLGNLIALQVTYTDADTTLETLSSISDIIIGAEENAFNNIADQVGSLRGQADADDYLAAGVTSVDAQTLDRILPILNAAVGQQEDAGDVDSAAEIEALIATIMEGQDDDCDGLPNMLEGIADTDGDGIIDRNDTDADNDGIRDNLEYGSLMTSSIRLDAAIVVDRDSSELTSAVDDPVSTCSLLGDSDRDGIIDFFDISPYGDGKVRSAAFVGTLEAEAVDENLDGVRDDRDSKEEFIAALDALIVTSVEDESRIISPAAFLPIRVVYNVTADVDSDGLINSLDLDADNDGVIDLIEAGHSDDDTNGLLDEGTDLIEDAEALVDSDADGIPDFLQLKSDGVTFDLIKAGILSSLDGNNDGRIDSLTDVDLDGLMDVIDNAIGFFGSLEDFDGDGIPNHLDDDDDGDGIPDREENDQFSFFTGEDADGDGIDDGIDALINGIIQGLDTNNNGVLDDRELADLDGDGIADYLDIDADGDGIRDDLDDLIELFVEEGPSQAPVLDADGDGVLDSEDVSVNSGADVKAGGAISTAFYMLIMTILAFTARARRTLVAFVMMFGLVAQANAGALSVEGGVGFARFDPDLQITPSESDTLDAGASIGVGAHLNDELGLTLSYFNLGDASINTARISYRATSLALQYRPSFARAGGWALQVEALGSDIDMSSEKGLQVDDSDEIVMGFGLGADYQVNDAERIELMFNRLSSDVDFFSVSYRLLFEI